jgi:hypothetical protein
MRRTVVRFLFLLLAPAGCAQPSPVPPGAASNAGVVAPVAPAPALPPAGAPAAAAPAPAPSTATATAPPAATAPDAPAPTPPEAPAPAELDARFVPLVAAAFRDYRAWGRVDDQVRWAPWLCRMPMPAQARMSAAEEGGHARKLYSVLAKDRGQYPGFQKGKGAPLPQQAGQAIVKESYFPDPVSIKEPALDRAVQEILYPGDHFHAYASDGKQTYRASRMAGVYVMVKLPRGTAGTDAGWIYGTVTPEGQVTSAGRVASCMGCHAAAPHDRLFGLGPAASAGRLTP